MIAPRLTTTAQLAALRRRAYSLGYTLTEGDYEQGQGWWLARDALVSMAQWWPDLNAVELALESAAQKEYQEANKS